MFLGSLLANFHQGSIVPCHLKRTSLMTATQYGGTQCTVLAVVALLFGAFHLQPSNRSSMSWQSSILASVIVEGDRLYTEIVANSFLDDRFHLFAHDEIPSHLTVLGSEYTFLPISSFTYGVVSNHMLPNGTDVDIQTGAVTLTHALHRLFHFSKHGLLTFNGETLAVWKGLDGFHIFDSYARNHLGNACQQESAVLLDYTDIVDLVKHLCTRYFDCVFNASPVALGQAESVQQNRESPMSVDVEKVISHHTVQNESASHTKGQKCPSNHELLSQRLEIQEALTLAHFRRKYRCAI